MSVPLINQTVTGDRNIFTAKGDIKIVYNLPPTEAEDHRNLLILRKRVEQFWVEGVLEKSVYNEALLSIDKEVDTEAVGHPWESVLELPNQTAETLPPGKKNIAIFEQVGRSLLILGEPGSGKTISLLELTRDLINNIKDDPSQPVPVVFNLSTWATRHRKFSDWLIEELKTKYSIPNRMGQSWLEKNRLLLFLDGLDEVKVGHRANCVHAINEFTQELLVPGIVVCSRITEYLALPLRLKFSGAIRLQPLSLDQVDVYLARAGARLAALRATLQQDSQLQALAQLPLMLSIMSVAYQDKPVAVPASEKIDNAEAGYKHVFDTYMKRMLERRGKAGQPFSKEQTKHWLSWLAQKMRENSQTIFLIEQLQPSWLSTRLLRSIYTLGSRGLAGLVWGMSIALALGFGVDGGSKDRVVGLMFGVVAGLTSGIRDLIVLERNSKKDKITYETSIRHVLIATSFYALTWGLLLNLVVILSEVGFRNLSKADIGFLTGDIIRLFAFGIIGAILQVLVFGPRYKEQTLRNDISTYETLSWSWSSALKLSSWGVALSLAVVIIILASTSLINFRAFERYDAGESQVNLLIHLTEDRLNNDPTIDQEQRDALESQKKELIAQAEQYRIRNASKRKSKPLLLRWISSQTPADLLPYLRPLLITAFVGGLIGALFGGLASRVIEIKSLPNQGIRLTIRNAVLTAAICGAIVGLVTGTIVYKYSFPRSYIYGIEWVLVAGIFTGVIIGLRYGGLDTIKHFLLRALIVSNGNAPKRYPDFLDHASNLILLQKVGGGYIFIHRLLLEYFADLPAAPQGISEARH